MPKYGGRRAAQSIAERREYLHVEEYVSQHLLKIDFFFLPLSRDETNEESRRSVRGAAMLSRRR